MENLNYKDMPPMEVIKDLRDFMNEFPDSSFGVIADCLWYYGYNRNLKKEELNFFVKTLCQTKDSIRILDIMSHFKNLSENNMTKLLSTYIENAKINKFRDLSRELNSGREENLQLAQKVILDITGQSLTYLAKQEEPEVIEMKKNDAKAQEIYKTVKNKNLIPSQSDCESWTKILCKSNIKNSINQYIDFACETKGLTQENIRDLISAIVKLDDEDAIKILKINMLSKETIAQNANMIFKEFEKLTGRKLHEENIEFPDEENLFSFNLQ